MAKGILSEIKKLLERWKVKVTAGLLTLGFIVWGFSQYLPPWLLPLAMGLLTAAFLALLSSMEKRLGALEELGGESLGIKEAESQILELLKQGQHRVKVIAAVGGWFKDAVFQHIRNEVGSRLKVTVLLADPTVLDEPWKGESIISKNSFVDGGADVRHYNHLPWLRGVLIDGKHLFLGFYYWDVEKRRIVLRGTPRPFAYFRSAHEQQFDVFNGWFEKLWSANNKAIKAPTG